MPKTEIQTIKQNLKYSSLKNIKNAIFSFDFNTFFSKNTNLFLIVLVGIYLFFSCTLFNPYIAPMSDDADYIIDVYNATYEGIYPSFRSILYGISLIVPIYFFGLNIGFIKILSLISAILGFIFTYLAFKKEVSPFVLLGVMLIYSLNYGIHFYDSSTMSEALFMMVQAVYFFVIFKFINKVEALPNFSWQEIRKNLKYWLAFGMISWLLPLSKNIGIIAPLVSIVFFIAYKQWRNAIVSFLFFLLFKIPYDLIVKFIFKTNVITSQWDGFLLKDYYKPYEGNEDLKGLMLRFFENVNQYISKDFLRVIALRDHVIANPITIASVGIVIACIIGLFIAYKHSKDCLQHTTYNCMPTRCKAIY